MQIVFIYSRSYLKAQLGENLLSNSFTLLLPGEVLADDNFLPCGPLHIGSSHDIWLLQSKTSRGEGGERERESGHSLFCNLIAEVMSYHFCHILLIRSISSLGPVTEGRRLTTKMQNELKAVYYREMNRTIVLAFVIYFLKIRIWLLWSCLKNYYANKVKAGIALKLLQWHR